MAIAGIQKCNKPVAAAPKARAIVKYPIFLWYASNQRLWRVMSKWSPRHVEGSSGSESAPCLPPWVPLNQAETICKQPNSIVANPKIECIDPLKPLLIMIATVTPASERPMAAYKQQ